MNYNLNYKELWKQLLPPVLRNSRVIAWGAVLLQPIQWLHDFIFGEYSDGAVYNTYSNATAYVIGDKVIYTDRGVYECITNTTGNLPTNATYWKLVNNNYIGIRERIVYNSQKILFEYALNRWFVCSGIYITNNDKDTVSFLMGNTGENSSLMPNSSTNQIDYLGSNLIVTSINDFTIYVPIAVHTALSPDSGQRDNIIRSFADKLTIAGMKYNIVTY